MLKKIVFVSIVMGICGVAYAIQSPFSLGTVPPPGATPYCLNSASSVPAGYMISTRIISTASPITVTDGTNIYAATVSGVSVSCFIKQ